MHHPSFITTERTVSKDKLSTIADKAREFRDTKLRLAELEEQLSKTREQYNQIRFHDLVDLLDEVGVTNIGLPAEGNMPAVDITLKPYYHAKIPEDKAEKAFSYLTETGHGDLIKQIITVTLGKGEYQTAEYLIGILEQASIAYARKQGVPWNTLTAWLRAEVETTGVAPPLDILGATIGRIAEIKEAK